MYGVAKSDEEKLSLEDKIWKLESESGNLYQKPQREQNDTLLPTPESKNWWDKTHSWGPATKPENRKCKFISKPSKRNKMIHCHWKGTTPDQNVGGKMANESTLKLLFTHKVKPSKNLWTLYFLVLSCLVCSAWNNQVFWSQNLSSDIFTNNVVAYII